MFGLVGTLLGGIGALGALSAMPFIGPIIAFFASPVGRILLVYVILPLMIFGYGFYKGDKHGDRQCADARIEQNNARLRLEANLAKNQAATAKSVAAELEEQNREAEGKIRDLEKQLKEKPTVIYTNDCRVPTPGGVRDKSRPK